MPTLRRMRVRYLPFHNPPVWSASFDPPGKSTCYCHAATLAEMLDKLKDYFTGAADLKPLYVEERFKRFLPAAPAKQEG